MTDLENKFLRAAHHESGHLVVAAANGLELRKEGLIIDASGEGLACYNKDPKGSDVLRSRIIIASYAGFRAEERFCEAHSLPDPTLGIIDTLDWREARALLNEISCENLFRGSVPSTRIELENQSTQLVDQHYAAITALASVVLSKEWEPLPVLKSGANWSHEKVAKCVRGNEVIAVLALHGISASLALD